MHTTKVIKNFTETELQKGIGHDASWHQDYKDSAYVYVGGLHYEMNEGDVSTVFSQYGELVDVRIMRDKKTGKSRGFAFVAYEDQRSTVLAVDNFNGAEVCGRTIRVDHVKKFKPPKEFLEVKEGEEGDDVPDEEKIYKPSGPDGRGWGQYRDYTEEELELMRLEGERVEKTKDQMSELYEKMEETRKKVIIDEDERWESMLMSRVEAEEDQRLKHRQEMEKKILKEKKKQAKLERKEAKKEKKEKKEKKKKKKEKIEAGDGDIMNISTSKLVEYGEEKVKKEKKHKRESRSRSKSADRNKERENKHKDKKKGHKKDKSRSRSKSRSDSEGSEGKGRQRHDTSSERDERISRNQ